MAYDFWYSTFARRDKTALAVGSRLHQFELEDENETVISSDQFRGKPALFMFYRGNWCPLCMAQIKEVAANYRELERRGVQAVMVSPQPHQQTATLAKQFDAPMRFLVDAGNRAARKLRIVDEGRLPTGLQAAGYDSDTTMPTVVITGNGISGDDGLAGIVRLQVRAGRMVRDGGETATSRPGVPDPLCG